MAQVELEEKVREAPTLVPGFSFWPWLLQRVTGVVLLILLTFHIVVNHIFNIAEVEDDILPGLVVFSDVADRFEIAGYWVLAVLLLAFALFHGLNGIRNILLDYGLRGTGDKIVTGTLLGLGVVAFTFGIIAVAAFVV
jgi:succinate dehydrogenase / fumarate reductase membrane anchor subunit